LVLSKDRSKIVSIASQRPEYCRYAQQQETGEIKNVLINANWDTGEQGRDKVYTTRVPMINPYNDPVDFLRERKQGYKFIYPVNDPSPGTTFYQEAEWHTAIHSGWFDVAQSVPEFKKHLFENQVTIKYMIEVSTWWWNWKYPGFDEFTTEKKQELMQKELDRFESFMSGKTNSGNSLMVTIKNDPQFTKEFSGWKITPVDNKLKDGIYIEDSQEASSHIMFALGVHPTLIGNTPGTKMGAGSGSDQRVAFNNHILMQKPHQDMILEPLEFIRDYNGWDPNIQFWFRNYFQATLDKAKQPQQESQQQAS